MRRVTQKGSRPERARPLEPTAFTYLFLLLLLFLFPNEAVTAPWETLFQTQTTTIATLQIVLADSAQETRNASERWYESILRQQQIIAEQIDELRSKLDQNLVSSQDFLAGLSLLFDRTDRLYIQWKKLGFPSDASRASRPWSQAALMARKDMAVGRSINYLRLSLINFFLGYADSDGIQISTAETQIALSKAWRIRSLLFLKTLNS